MVQFKIMFIELLFIFYLIIIGLIIITYKLLATENTHSTDFDFPKSPEIPLTKPGVAPLSNKKINLRIEAAREEFFNNPNPNFDVNKIYYIFNDNGIDINEYNKLRQAIINTQTYRNWRNLLVRKAHKKCEKCNCQFCLLDVHHKNSFFNIVIQNRITTLKEAFYCKELWNYKNGEVLCRECHQQTESYKLKQNYANI